MEQLEVELIVQNIAQWLVSEQCIGSLTVVCKKWYCFLKKMHLEQYHQFKHGRNRILQSIDKGFVHFRIYKPILSTSHSERIQYALVHQIKCIDTDDPNKSLDLPQNPFLIKCTDITISHKDEFALEQKCDYILTRCEISENLKRSLIIEEIKEDYPPQLIIETRPHFHEVQRQVLSPPLPRKKANSKNLIRKYVKQYKTASRLQLITNQIKNLVRV